MPDATTRFTTDKLVLRIESGKLILPSAVAQRIENFEFTTEGTLKSVRGPMPLVHDYEAEQPGGFPFYDGYGNFHGIFHCLLMRETRDVLLLHSGDEIYTFQGWSHDLTPWATLIGPASSSPQIVAALPNDKRPRFPTQFESTPTGVVIVPQGNARAYFYDGEMALPLGYDQMPAPPTGYGPETTTAESPNGGGYSIAGVKVPTKFQGGDSTADDYSRGDPKDPEHIFGLAHNSLSAWNLNVDFGYGRLGTTQMAIETSMTGGILLECMWQAAVQWVDKFGNLSPISPRSNPVHFHPEGTALLNSFGDETGSDGTSDGPFDPLLDSALAIPGDSLLREIAWGNIDPGPTGTVGRILLRTKDTKSSDNQLRVVPGNVGYGSMASLTTLPDNISTIFPDNVPDSWLVSLATDVRPVPTFKLCRLSMGSLWIANTTDNPGEMIPSLPRQYGTFARTAGMVPDPNGGEITGLWSTGGGLLAFTRTSTFMVTPNDSGVGFRASTLHANIGCVAPSSLANFTDGTVIWLGMDGFYQYDGETIQLISEPIRPLTDRINAGRALSACAAVDTRSREYRCWVSLDAATENNTCLIYDGEGWRRRTQESLEAVCVTRDHREYMIGIGTATILNGSEEQNVWVLDHSSAAFSVRNPEVLVETSWIEWGRSQDRKSAKTIYLALRESDDAAAIIEVHRDWRITGTPIYADTSNATLYSTEDIPNFWGKVAWDARDSQNVPVEWSKRRPYWKRVDIDVPSCEVYKIIIRSTSRIEFIGMAVDEEPKLGGFGSRIP